MLKIAFTWNHFEILSFLHVVLDEETFIIDRRILHFLRIYKRQYIQFWWTLLGIPCIWYLEENVMLYDSQTIDDELTIADVKLDFFVHKSSSSPLWSVWNSLMCRSRKNGKCSSSFGCVCAFEGGGGAARVNSCFFFAFDVFSHQPALPTPYTGTDARVFSMRTKIEVLRWLMPKSSSFQFNAK